MEPQEAEVLVGPQPEKHSVKAPLGQFAPEKLAHPLEQRQLQTEAVGPLKHPGWQSTQVEVA